HKREDFQLFGECGILTVNPYHFDTNPLEEVEIPRYSKGIEEVEFRIKAESFKQVNDDNTAGSVKSLRKSQTLVNGIPQDVREKFMGTWIKTKTLIATRADKGRLNTIEES
ncbi:hypothetical protein Tco_1243163, partial [Tanacetum coccineum]